MSESEKKLRAEYQQNRTRQIYVRGAVLAALVIVALLCGMSAGRLSQTAYVTYTEGGCADYQVSLKNNQFYDQDSLGREYAYISVLVDQINAKLDYTMQAAGKAEYNYSYYVDAKLEILDKDSGAALFDPVYDLTPLENGTSTEKKLQLQQEVTIDYHKYNELAREFISTYALDRPESNLIVTMHVAIDGTCPNVEGGQSGYEVSLRIPLNKTTLKIETNTSVPQAAAKVLACNNGGARFLTVLSIVLAAAAVAWAVLLAVYIFRTRDHHINYSRRLKKILSSYRSYIQKISTPLDPVSYQVLQVETFQELLEIRDTLQKPILMHENADQTCTKFVVPSDAGLLYSYEISVVGVYASV